MNPKNELLIPLLIITSILIAQAQPIVGNSYEAIEFVNISKLEYKKVTFQNDTTCQYSTEKMIINSSGDTVKDENYSLMIFEGKFQIDENNKVEIECNSPEESIIQYTKTIMFEILDDGQRLKLVENDLIFNKMN